MKLENLVYSTGEKKFDNFLNVLRIFYGERDIVDDSREKSYLKKYIEEVSVLETDVDDVAGEILGDFINTIEKEDILDVQLIPTLTKKNRPGHLIKVLCHPKYQFQIIEKIIEELGTLGVRFSTINRVCVNREIKTLKINVDNNLFDLRYKISYIDSETDRKIVNIKPEYEDINHISKETELTVKEVLFIAQEKIHQIFKEF